MRDSAGARKETRSYRGKHRAQFLEEDWAPIASEPGDPPLALG